MSKEQFEFINEYIKKLENAINEYNQSISLNSNDEDMLFDIIIEICGIFKNELPNIEESLWLRTDTSIRDANLLLGSLRKYLIDNGYKPTIKVNDQLSKFWISFKTYFENELPYKDILKSHYIRYDNWDGGIYSLDINYNYEFNLHLGINYNENDFVNISTMKIFIELAFSEWIKIDKRYDFTKDVNNIFNNFKLPYKLQRGKVVSQGFKTTIIQDKIINYSMLERKIQYAEEMILSTETLDKKCALDYIIDALQYIISIQDGKRITDKYSTAAKNISNNLNGKTYSVIKTEIEELMKISNEYFDIRHNEYLNKSKEVREAISDSAFIEYLYNRAYSLLYILRLKNPNVISINNKTT